MSAGVFALYTVYSFGLFLVYGVYDYRIVLNLLGYIILSFTGTFNSPIIDI